MQAVSSVTDPNRFEDFFQDSIYLEFKNHLYNYKRRQKEIRSFLNVRPEDTVLEIGSGVSPILNWQNYRVIYSDLSEQAMRCLHLKDGAPRCLVTSATHASFGDASVNAIVCSEVLEHVPDDIQALQEMFRMLKPGGQLVITVPIHAYYFTEDDRFVRHCRRYVPHELLSALTRVGFADCRTSKVAGFLDKVFMLTAVQVFEWVSGIKSEEYAEARKPKHAPGLMKFLLPFYIAGNWFYEALVWLEAKVMPLPVTSILLVSCQKP